MRRAENVRNCRVWIHQRACGLQDRGTRSIELVVGMQEEQNIEGLFQNWIWNVVLFSHVVHHVQEACSAGLMSQRNQSTTKGSRSSVAEVGGRDDKFSTLANSVRHTGWTLQRQSHALGYSTHAARVVALPISRYICLSIIAKDSASPLVYNFWPNEVFNSRPRRKMGASTLKRRVGFTVVRSQVSEGTRQNCHGVRIVTTCLSVLATKAMKCEHTGRNGRTRQHRSAQPCVG